MSEPTPGVVKLLDRYRGAMLGLAAGDALGTTLEFRAPGLNVANSIPSTN